MDLAYISLAALACFVMLAVAANTRNAAQPFQWALTATTFYYAVAGSTYWIVEKDAQFVGVDWSGAIGFPALILSFYSALVSITVLFLTTSIGTTASPAVASWQSGTDAPLAEKLIGVLGATTAAYVIISTQFLGKTENSGDPLFLVAYQCSDSLIPYCLLKFASATDSRKKALYALAYASVGIAIGFRYKLALFFGPIALYVAYDRRPYTSRFEGFGGFGALSRLALAGAAVIGSLSILTLIRRPFDGVDLSSVGEFEQQDFLYGLFAESNTIFGLSSIVYEFNGNGVYFYFDSIRDAFLELVPRFLFPERVTGAYLMEVVHRMKSTEALSSGTAYNYVGEWILMFGFVGAVFGTFVLALAVTCYIRLVTKFAESRQTALMGYCLAAIYYGYYFFSRGYFAQSLKGFIFVALPYLLILHARHKNLSRFQNAE